MKIDIKIIREYLNKVSLNTTIPTINFNFTEDGVKTRVRSMGNAAITEGLLKKEAFEEYEAIGELYIKNSKLLIDSLKSFEGSVTLEIKNDNIFKISTDKREIYNMLAEKSICENIIEECPVVASTVDFAIDKKILTQSVADMNMLKVNNVTFIKKDDLTYIQIGEDNEYDVVKNHIDCSVEGDVRVGVGASFEEVVSALGNSVRIFLADDLPLVFEDHTQFMEVKTILAPFIKR